MKAYLAEVVRAYGFEAPTEKSRFVETDEETEAIIQRLLPQPERREEKRQLTWLLEQMTGQSRPWGALTGVRPTTMLQMWQRQSQLDDDVLAKALEAYYGIHPHQVKLGLRTARREMEIESTFSENALLFYLSIPFCPSRCTYCSFVPHDGIQASHETQKAYVDAVLEEVRGAWYPPEAIYIGGGTPTALEPQLFKELMQALEALPGWLDVPERTLEAGRCDTLTDEMLHIIDDLHFHSICLNPQSLDPEVLKAVGRPGSLKSLRETFDALRQMGLRIHMDLIFGLPKESAEGFLEGIEKLIEIEPEAITIHALAKKKGADLTELDSPLGEKTLAKAQLRLIDAGYEPYYLYRHKYAVGGLENCSFAKPGFETRYNVAMMDDQHPVLACGVCGISKELRGDEIIRHANRRTLASYFQLKPEDRPSEGQLRVVESCKRAK